MNIDHKFCPECGHDLVADQPIILNDFSMLSELSPLCYRGRPVKIGASARRVCWMLMRAYPRPVRIETILMKLESDAEGNVVDVYLSRLRHALRDIEAPIPFETIRARVMSGEYGAGKARAVVWKVD